MDRALYDSVTEFFDLPDESLLPVLEDIYCEKDLKELKKSAVKYDKNEPVDLLRDFMQFENKGIAVLMWPEGPPSKSNYWMPDDIMTQNGMFIRDQLRFKKDYQKFVDKMLRDVARTNKSGKETLFVGMHARRTDYVEFSKKYLNQKVSGKNHFLEAMEYFQEEYPEYEIFFIAVSDDMSWMKKHFGNIHNVVLAGMDDKKNHDQIPFGLNPIGVDFCLLSSCNHTIVSQVIKL